jgi:hypothetical protein
VRTLTIFVDEEQVDLVGKDREEVLQKLEHALSRLGDEGLAGVRIDTDSKSACSIETLKSFNEKYGDDEDDSPSGNKAFLADMEPDVKFFLEIEDDGSSTVREFSAREEVVAAFMQAANEKGDHWD